MFSKNIEILNLKNPGLKRHDGRKIISFSIAPAYACLR